MSGAERQGIETLDCDHGGGWSRLPRLLDGSGRARGLGVTLAEGLPELVETIDATPCDVVAVEAPVDLGRVLEVEKTTRRELCELRELGSPTLADLAQSLAASARAIRTDAREAAERKA